MKNQANQVTKQFSITLPIKFYIWGFRVVFLVTWFAWFFNVTDQINHK